MSQIIQINCDYLVPNKTIETIRVLHDSEEIEIFVYNYKGQSLRVFLSKKSLDDFWLGKADEDYHFRSEQELDNWLNGFFLG